MAKAKDPKIKALQLNLEGLLRLLGGTPEERLRFWEFTKGITSRAENELIAIQVDALQGLVNQVQVSTKALKKTASQIAKG